MLKLYNTLTRKKEVFKPIKKGEVRMYVCGPTVNDIPHLGHAMQQVAFDVLRRYLEYLGYKVKFVSNITDIEDKIINKANELGVSVDELVKKNEKFHKEDYERLNVRKPDVQPHATEYIREMILLISKLEKNNYTYLIENDGVYFDTSKFKKYGLLSQQNLNDKKTKSRISKNDNKKNNQDFVLWKFSKPNEPCWDSPWGAGRPGWHIECSAMSHAILGMPFDIHGGGQDLIFPHHEDEIAQSESAFGKKVCNYWIHNGMVNVEGVKMSKSLGNFRTIRDLLSIYSPQVVRFSLLLAHYRSIIDFSEERMNSARTTFSRIEKKIIEIKKANHVGKDFSDKYRKEFLKAMDNDLNTPKAIQVLHELINNEGFDSEKKLKLIYEFDQVLGLNLKEIKEEKQDVPADIKELLGQREKARNEKKWDVADEIREKIKKKGFLVEDSPEGMIVRKIE